MAKGSPGYAREVPTEDRTLTHMQDSHLPLLAWLGVKGAQQEIDRRAGRPSGGRRSGGKKAR